MINRNYADAYLYSSARMYALGFYACILLGTVWTETLLAYLQSSDVLYAFFFSFFFAETLRHLDNYVKKNNQELSFIIKLRHRFSLIRKLIKSFCNYACCPISQHFKQTDLRFSRNKEIRIPLWCMDLNKTLYHIAHPLRCLVLLSVFFFSFSFAEVEQFLVVKTNSEEVHYFPTRESCFQVQLNLSPTATEEEIEDITWPRRDTNFIFEC